MSSAINKDIEQIQERYLLAKLNTVTKGKLSDINNHLDVEYTKACKKARENAISNFLKEKKRKRKKKRKIDSSDTDSDKSPPKKKHKTLSKNKKKKHKKHKKHKKAKVSTKKKTRVRKHNEVKAPIIEETQSIPTNNDSLEETQSPKEPPLRSKPKLTTLEYKLPQLAAQISPATDSHNLTIEDLEAQKREAKLRQKALAMLMSKLKSQSDNKADSSQTQTCTHTQMTSSKFSDAPPAELIPSNDVSPFAINQNLLHQSIIEEDEESSDLDKRRSSLCKGSKNISAKGKVITITHSTWLKKV